MTFDEYATSNLSTLVATARAICGRDAVAEDVVQDVLIKLNARWERIEPLDGRDAYIRRMLLNEFLSWRRKWSRVVPHAEPERHGSYPDQSAAVVQRDALLADIARLPPRQRAVIGLKFFADLTDEQIAADLGCSVNTVRTHSSRALAALRVQAAAAAATTPTEPERSADRC